MYSKEELKNLKKEFWESFGVYCSLQPGLRNRKKIWILYDTKIKGVELKFDVTRKAAFVILEVNHKNEEERLEAYERLTWYTEAIEKDFTDGLTWEIFHERENGKQVARVYTKHEGIDFHRREDWGTFFSFMAQNMMKLERNFLSIADYIRVE